MRKFLGIDKALQSIIGELILNVSKLTEINKDIGRETKKLEEVENNTSYSDEQEHLYIERLDDLNIEKKGRLEIISRKRKELQTQVARIKQTLERVLDKDRSLAERIRPLFREQGTIIASKINCNFNYYFNNSSCSNKYLWRGWWNKSFRFYTKR